MEANHACPNRPSRAWQAAQSRGEGCANHDSQRPAHRARGKPGQPLETRLPPASSANSRRAACAGGTATGLPRNSPTSRLYSGAKCANPVPQTLHLFNVAQVEGFRLCRAPQSRAAARYRAGRRKSHRGERGAVPHRWQSGVQRPPPTPYRSTITAPRCTNMSILS